jgi:hypothetical protein
VAKIQQTGRTAAATLKERALRRGPCCVLCGHSGRGPSSQLHLTHGISVWLCAVHSSEAFLRRRGGRDFAERLVEVWVAGGVARVRCIEAARAHVRQIRNAYAGRTLPGSYSWPRLRKEAERRFSLGDDPNLVIDELRRDYADGPAMVPSERTMRRWFSDGRWRSPCLHTAKPRRPRHRVLPPHRRPQPSHAYLSMRRTAFPWLGPWKDDP